MPDNDQWQKKLAEVWAENERLREEVAEVRAREADEHRECDEHEENSARIIGELRAENERLRAENAQLLAAIGSWRQALDRAEGSAPLETTE